MLNVESNDFLIVYNINLQIISLSYFHGEQKLVKSFYSFLTYLYKILFLQLSIWDISGFMIRRKYSIQKAILLEMMIFNCIILSRYGLVDFNKTCFKFKIWKCIEWILNIKIWIVYIQSQDYNRKKYNFCIDC